MKEKSKINTFLSCHHSSNLNLPQSSLKYSIAKGDSGASNHYFCTKSSNTLLDVCPDPYGPTVTLPNNETIRATHQGHLPFATHLSPQATKTSLFPNLHNNLISVGQLCDDGCTVTFTKSTMKVAKKLQNNLLRPQKYIRGRPLEHQFTQKFPTSTSSSTKNIISTQRTISKCNSSQINTCQRPGNLPACGLLLTSEAHILESHQKQSLHRLAWLIRITHLKTLASHHCNCQRTHQTRKAESTINF